MLPVFYSLNDANSASTKVKNKKPLKNKAGVFSIQKRAYKYENEIFMVSKVFFIFISLIKFTKRSIISN